MRIQYLLYMMTLRFLPRDTGKWQKQALLPRPHWARHPLDATRVRMDHRDRLRARSGTSRPSVHARVAVSPAVPPNFSGSAEKAQSSGHMRIYIVAGRANATLRGVRRTMLAPSQHHPLVEQARAPRKACAITAPPRSTCKAAAAARDAAAAKQWS